jgi:hypothetical protein
MNITTQATGAQPTWFVGASFGGTDDQLPRFLADGISEDGSEDKHLDVVRSMLPGDRIAVKTAYTRKRDCYCILLSGAWSTRPSRCIRFATVDLAAPSAEFRSQLLRMCEPAYS